MFGYVKPFIPELKVKEHELYKAMYCGLCNAMGEHICNSNRMTLSYDILFLALVRCGISNETIHIEGRRCIAHPLKKRNHAFTPEALKYCARVSAVLTYYNIEDDVRDNKGFAALKNRALMPMAAKYLKKADMPELSKIASSLLRELCDIENEDRGADVAAECFGRLLGEFFAYDIKDPHKARLSYEIGFHVGKWIYIADATDDFEKDRKKGNYNPFLSFEVLPKDMIDTTLTLERKAATEALDRLEIGNQPLASIIKNILTLGMDRVQEEITGENK